MESRRPKQIHFVSSKKHKVDEAMRQVDDVCNGFIDDIIFEVIIDVFREKAFPKSGSVSIADMIYNEPIFTPLEPFDFKPEEMKRGQKCPRCRIQKPDGRDIDAGRFTFHLAEHGCGCFHVPYDERMEILRSYFRDEGKPKDP